MRQYYKIKLNINFKIYGLLWIVLVHLVKLIPKVKSKFVTEN